MSKDSPNLERAEQILAGLKKNFTALEEFASNDTSKRTQKDDLRNADPKNSQDDAETLSKFHESRINAFRDNALKSAKAEIETVDPQLFKDTVAKINAGADAELAKLAPKPVKDQQVKDSPIAAALKEKLFENNIPFEVPIANIGLTKGILSTGPMPTIDKQNFIDRLSPYIDLSEVNAGVVARNSQAIEQKLRPLIREAINTNFGKKIQSNGITSTTSKTLDEQLMRKNIEAFGAMVSQQVTSYAIQLELAERTFQQCEDKGVKFSAKDKDKIMSRLSSTLEVLGNAHLEKDMDRLADTLSDELKNNRTLLSRITGRAKISTTNLDSICLRLGN